MYHMKSHGVQSSIYEWTVINGNHLPENFPLQTDGYSCGVFVGLTVYYWIKHRRLPTINDCTQADCPLLVQ